MLGSRNANALRHRLSDSRRRVRRAAATPMNWEHRQREAQSASNSGLVGARSKEDCRLLAEARSLRGPTCRRDVAPLLALALRGGRAC